MEVGDWRLEARGIENWGIGNLEIWKFGNLGAGCWGVRSWELGVRLIGSSAMAHTVFCVKLQRELPGLDTPPWPGELGQRIYDNISTEAWKMWEERMKMILNEYRLMPWQKEAQQLVAKHMEDFFFGEGAALPPGYVPPQGKQ